MALETELATYAKELQGLLADDGEGKFVLIQGHDVNGVYSTYEDAVCRYIPASHLGTPDKMGAERDPYLIISG